MKHFVVFNFCVGCALLFHNVSSRFENVPGSRVQVFKSHSTFALSVQSVLVALTTRLSNAVANPNFVFGFSVHSCFAGSRLELFNGCVATLA